MVIHIAGYKKEKRMENSLPENMIPQSFVSSDTQRAEIARLHRKFAHSNHPLSDTIYRAADWALIEPRYLEETLRHVTLRRRVLQLLPRTSDRNQVGNSLKAGFMSAMSWVLC